MKKRKFLLVIIALCSMLCISFMLTACDGFHTHILTRHEAVSPTCTTDGIIEHWECTECGKYFSDADGTEEITKDKAVVAAMGHNYIKGICELCGDIKYSQGLTFKTNAESTGYLVTGLGECMDKDIRIPNEYNGSPVLGIDSGAFSGCVGITSITIPDSVTTIGDSAFSGCSGLTSITIGNGVTTIGNRVFVDCSGLESITISKGNTKYHSNGNCIIETATKTLIAGWKSSVIPTDGSVTTIGSNALYNCSGLTSITIPNSVTSIGKGAFGECNSLTSITIPFVGNTINGTENTHFGYIFGGNNDSVPASLKEVIITGGTTIGNSAFSECGGLTSITIPNSVTNIGWRAFGECNSLTSITIPFVGNTINGTENTHFGYIFGGNNDSVPASLKEVIITGGTTIGHIAFRGCSGLTSVTIGNSVSEIGVYAFKGCSRLTSIEIPDSVTTIGNEAFEGCSGLTSITIGNGVTTIGWSAFEGCSSLKYNEYDNGLYLGNGSNLYVALIKAKDTSITSCTINEKTKIIYHGAFSGCVGLTSITIPDSVTTIGDFAFDGCSGLTSVTIGNGVTTIGYEAFSGCSGLTSVTIGNGVTTIGRSAFEGCSGLTSITIPNSVTTIDESAFEACISLTSVTIGNGVTTIGSYAFKDCNSLKYNVYDNGLYLGNGNNPYVALIKAKDTSITSCTINEKTKIICGRAFYDCSGLTSIVIPNSVTTIDNWAFYNCYRLISITIPDSVTTIVGGVFRNCNNLTKVYYKGTAEQWSNIIIDNSNNNYFINATRYYYSETKPTTPGNYWHYVDGKVVEW